MLLKRALIVTTFALAGAPALAATASTTATPGMQRSPAMQSVQAVKPTPRPARAKATPEQRAQVERLEPLARAAFWAREVDIDQTDMESRLKLAKALRALGKYEEAGANADQVLVVQPNNYEALLESARDRIGQNQGFYGIDPAQRAEALDRKSVV